MAEADILDISEVELDDEAAVQEIWERLNHLSGKDKNVLQRKSLGLFGNTMDGTRQKTAVPSISSPIQKPFEQATSPNPFISSPNPFLVTQPITSTSRITVETSSKKLKPFSGRSRISNGEVDYKHWRRAALRVVEDLDLAEGQKKFLILQSLTGLAEDSIELHRHLPSMELLEVLDKLFQTTVDGGDLLADFFQIFQQPTQTVSEYLNSLYVHLAEVVTLGGLTMPELPLTLLKQFVRGVNVNDEYIIGKLHLEEKFDSPPNFPDLFVSVRREESRRTERRLRHKKVARSQANTITSTDAVSETKTPTVSVPPTTPSGLESIKEEMAKIQQQLSSLMEKNPNPVNVVFALGVD